MGKVCKKDVTKELQVVKNYVKPTTYAMLSAVLEEKTGEKPRKRWFRRRTKKSNEEQVREFIRAVGKIGFVLYGGVGNDTQTLINVMELMFAEQDYKLIGNLAEMMEPDEDDEVAKSLKYRLLNSRSNLTEFQVTEERKVKDDEKEKAI